MCQNFILICLTILINSPFQTLKTLFTVAESTVNVVSTSVMATTEVVSTTEGKLYLANCLMFDLGLICL